MQKESSWFEDVTRMASGAAGAMLDIRSELKAAVQACMDEWLARSHLVRREELEAALQMAATARKDAEEVKAQLAVLQATVDELSKR